MKNKNLVSIIVPVYNVENYLEECINSIFSQTYNEIEIIAINDGSTDNSLNVLKKLSKKDKRLKVINKSNGGVSSARNLGLNKANGSYITFVDADDVISPNYLQHMVKSIKNYDMAVCGYYEFYVNKKIMHKISDKEKTISTKTANEMIFSKEGFGGYLWNKIFKKDIITKNNILFNHKIHMCEDQVFVTEYLLHTKKIKLTNECLYYYRMRKGSAVWNKNSNKILTLFDAYIEINKIYNQNNIENIYFQLNLYTDLCKYKQKINIQNIEKQMNIKIKHIYKKIIKANIINNKQKIKLFVLCKLPIVYELYMKNKLSTYQQFA